MLRHSVWWYRPTSWSSACCIVTFFPSVSGNVCIFIFCMRATCSALVTFRGIIALTIGHGEYKLLSFVLCIFFSSFCHCLLLIENVFPVAHFPRYSSVTASAGTIYSLRHWPWIMWPDTCAFRQLFEKNYDRKEMPVLALCTADIYSALAASCAAIALQQRLLPFTYYVSVVYDFRPNIFDKSLHIYMNLHECQSHSPELLLPVHQTCRPSGQANPLIWGSRAFTHSLLTAVVCCGEPTTSSTSVAFHSATNWRS
jgi:hypothetical protein